MKTLSQYVNDNYLYEGLSEFDKQLLNEGLGSFLGKIFGWTAGKTQNMVNDFKNSYETTLANVLVGKKSKDKKVQKDFEELQNEIKDCKNEEEVLEKYKVYGETLLTKTLKEIDDPLWPISVKRQLSNLGKKLNDKEAVELSEKLDKAIKKHWKENDVENADKTLSETEEKLKAKAKKEGGDKTNQETVEGDDEKVKQEVEDTIKEEKDILGPLAKEAGLDGQSLLEYITRKVGGLTKEDESDKNKKVKVFDPKAKDFDKDKFDKLVLGMCITICGAIITGDSKLFANIPGYLGLEDLDVKDLKKKVKKSENAKKKRATEKEA